MAGRNAKEIRVALGFTMQLLRRRAGMAQEDLAGAARIERAHMSLIERGKGNPTVETLHRILEVLGMSFEAFGVELDRQLRRHHRNRKPE